TLGLVVVVATASIAMTTVSTYSTGPAVIRSLARTPVIARTAGNIVFVDVMPGDHVTAGTVIARFDDTDHRETVSRLERELEMHLRNRMGDPRDTTADALLRNVRDQLASANAALDERLIRATTSGVVGDIRVRPGQHVEHGNLVSTVLQTNQGLEVIAMLPGEHRPQLVPGMLMRLELEGYQYAYQRVVIESVSPDVISPVEARRVLGSEIADGIALGAPVVLVRGRLASAQFVVDDRALAYHDGMRGIAEAHIGTEPTAFALIPGLRRLR
ncbi:MAG TPA: HlyD family efflux transporter periplasmic adaptor subunit, partial [Kofleriaceae bacterium]|nr:HlyD family efflux transporter periplasmic adaptor subunit [Kofleriaceae bacterium]